VDIQLGVAIAADHRRYAQATELGKVLLPMLAVGACTSLATVYDQGNGEWDTHSRAWEAHLGQDELTHGLVLEDDALPCQGMVDGALAAIQRFPTSAISLYFGQHENPYSRTSRVRRARNAVTLAQDFDDVSWISTPGLWWGVAVILPVAWIEPMLAYWQPRKTGLYDERISKWLIMHEKGPVYNTWPSLVDHADGPSLLRRHRKSGRRAFQTVRLARDWDPNGRVIAA
jgi:hypothetical protein